MGTDDGTARGHRWYRGDCHVHSTLSTAGELTAEQLAAAARAAGLDFIATTEHNTAEGHGIWDPDDDLLVIIGQEATTRSGHWLALGIDAGQVVEWRYGVDDDVIGRHLDQVHRVGGLCVVAHPHAPFPSGTFEYPYDGFDVVEVWNGLWHSDLPWNADNEKGLADWAESLIADIARGAPWRPAMGNSDVHLRDQIAAPHMVVLADELSSDAILAGIRAGRSWIAESAAVELSFAVIAGTRSAGIGDRLQTDGEPVTICLDICGVPSGVVALHTDHGEVHTETLPADGSGTVRWHTTAARSAFVRVEIRHAGGQMAALTNPLLLA